jgi:hypothetical protein
VTRRVLARLVWKPGRGESDPTCRLCGACFVFHRTDLPDVRRYGLAPWWCPVRLFQL